MAKKKKSASAFAQYSGFIALVLTIVTIVMFFLPNVMFKQDIIIGEVKETITGLQAAFGWSETKGSVTVTTLNFSILNTLAYVLPIAGVILMLLFKKSKLFNFIALACFVVSAVLLFIAPTTLVYANEIAAALKEVASLAYGAIVAGVMSILSALVVLGKLFIK